MVLDLAKVSEALNKEFQEPLSDLIARSNPLLEVISKKGVSTDQIYMKGKFTSNHGAGAIADGSTVTLSGTEGSTYKQAVLPWATYVSKFQVNKRLIDEVASNPGVIGSIFQEEIKDATKDLADIISRDIWGETVANGLVGLQDILRNDNSYAGIDRTVAGNERWQAVVLDAADAEISTDQLYMVETAFFNKNLYGFRENPALFTGMVTPQILEKYSMLFEKLDLTDLSTAHFVDQTNRTGFFGVSSVGWQGIPFRRDANVQTTGDTANTGRITFLDLSKLHLCALTPSNDPTVKEAQRVMGFMQGESIEGIPVKIELLANTGEFISGYIKTYIQLATNDPARVGALIKNISID